MDDEQDNNNISYYLRERNLYYLWKNNAKIHRREFIKELILCNHVWKKDLTF